MANPRGNKTIVAHTYYGSWREGIISGTPKPGIVVSIKSNTEPISGTHTWEAYNPGVGDGTPGMTAILDQDDIEGFTRDTAYQDGKRCRIFFPCMGDSLFMRKADITGTGSNTEDLIVGQKLLVVSGTGYVSPVAVGLLAAVPNYPFKALETVVDQPAEMLVLCIYTGYSTW